MVCYDCNTFLSYLWGIETMMLWCMTSKRKCFYRTYEGLKQCVWWCWRHPKPFLSYLWGIETMMCGDPRIEAHRFYRTYEGLKLTSLRSITSKKWGFYRTYEGLKRTSSTVVSLNSRSFYRTYEGLKRNRSRCVDEHAYGFYRTYEGLKLFACGGQANLWCFLSYPQGTEPSPSSRAGVMGGSLLSQS